MAWPDDGGQAKEKPRSPPAGFTPRRARYGTHPTRADSQSYTSEAGQVNSWPCQRKSRAPNAPGEGAAEKEIDSKTVRVGVRRQRGKAAPSRLAAGGRGRWVKSRPRKPDSIRPIYAAFGVRQRKPVQVSRTPGRHFPGFYGLR
jgi:hypothetical protein